MGWPAEAAMLGCLLRRSGGIVRLWRRRPLASVARVLLPVPAGSSCSPPSARAPCERSLPLDQSTSARHGAELLGRLVSEHGAGEAFGVLLADAREAWCAAHAGVACNGGPGCRGFCAVPAQGCIGFGSTRQAACCRPRSSAALLLPPTNPPHAAAAALTMPLCRRYLETASGHHWLAQRVPHDSFFISANQGRFQEARCRCWGSAWIDARQAAGSSNSTRGPKLRLKTPHPRPSCCSCLPQVDEGADGVLASPGLRRFAAENGLWDPASGRPFNYFEVLAWEGACEGLRSAHGWHLPPRSI